MVPWCIWPWHWVHSALNVSIAKLIARRTNNPQIQLLNSLMGNTLTQGHEVSINHPPSKWWKLFRNRNKDGIELSVRNLWKISTASSWINSFNWAIFLFLIHINWQTWFRKTELQHLLLNCLCATLVQCTNLELFTLLHLFLPDSYWTPGILPDWTRTGTNFMLADHHTNFVSQS